MKKLTLTLIFGLLFAGFTVSLKAQVSAAVTANASAEMVEALSADELTALNFGRFVPGSSTGTIIIDATEALNRSQTGGVTIVTASGNPAAGKFGIYGIASQVISVTLPGDNSVKLLNAANDELTIAKFTVSNANPTLGTDGSAIVYVGGTLNIPDNQAGLTKGIFTGTYAVTFQHN